MTVTHRDIDWSAMPMKLNRADRRRLAADTRHSLRRKKGSEDAEALDG